MDDGIIWEGVAALGYEAYGKSAGWKNFQGNPMPTWDELPEAIKKHWTEAAMAMGGAVAAAVMA